MWRHIFKAARRRCREAARICNFASARRNSRAMQRSLYFLGDSHLRPAVHAYRAGLFGGVECAFESVGGATAVGLRHPTSKTQALARFREKLLPWRAGVIPVFQLGEVDCGFVIWLRAQRYGESIEEQTEQSLAAYLGFLLEMRDAGYRELIVTSATPPTIREGDFGEVAHLRREVTATYAERSALVAHYNRRLGVMCAAHDLAFLDFTDDFVDPRTGLLNEALRNPSALDHHLDNERAGPIWARRVLDRIGMDSASATP
jgi:hypothetical protein